MKIELINITKNFQSRDGEIKSVFNGLSLKIDKPEFWTIVGPNGSGKSTLLNLIAGTDKPDQGTVVLDVPAGEQIKVGYVWQDYRASLLPWMNAYRNIEFPLRLMKLEKQERKAMINSLLDEVQVGFNINKDVYKLSGGQQQLVALLRSVVAAPGVLLCDEPFSALDQTSRWTMAFFLERLWLKKKIPVLFVSHDIDESILLGSKILLLNRGGKVEEVLENDLSRPRNIAMLSSDTHIRLREKVISFMKNNGAIQEAPVKLNF